MTMAWLEGSGRPHLEVDLAHGRHITTATATQHHHTRPHHHARTWRSSLLMVGAGGNSAGFFFSSILAFFFLRFFFLNLGRKRSHDSSFSSGLAASSRLILVTDSG